METYQIKQLNQILQENKDISIDIFKYKFTLPIEVSRPNGNTLVIMENDKDSVFLVYDRENISKYIINDTILYTKYNIDTIDKEKIVTILNKYLKYSIDSKDIDKLDRNFNTFTVKLKNICYVYTGECKFTLSNNPPINITENIDNSLITDNIIKSVKYNTTKQNTLHLYDKNTLTGLNEETIINAININNWDVKHSVSVGKYIYLFGNIKGDFYIGENTYLNKSSNVIVLNNNNSIINTFTIPINIDNILDIKSYDNEIAIYAADPDYKIIIYDTNLTTIIDTIILESPITAWDFNKDVIVYSTMPMNQYPFNSFYYVYSNYDYTKNYTRVGVIKYNRHNKNKYLLKTLTTRFNVDSYYIITIKISTNTIYCLLSRITFNLSMDSEILLIDDAEIIQNYQIPNNFFPILEIDIDNGELHYNPYDHPFECSYIDIYNSIPNPSGGVYKYRHNLDNKIILHETGIIFTTRTYHPITKFPTIGIVKIKNRFNVEVFGTKYPYRILEAPAITADRKYVYLSGKILDIDNIQTGICKVDINSMEMEYYTEIPISYNKLYLTTK